MKFSIDFYGPIRMMSALFTVGLFTVRLFTVGLSKAIVVPSLYRDSICPTLQSVACSILFHWPRSSVVIR